MKNPTRRKTKPSPARISAPATPPADVRAAEPITADDDLPGYWSTDDDYSDAGPVEFGPAG
jgi:hypothetical protein